MAQQNQSKGNRGGNGPPRTLMEHHSQGGKGSNTFVLRKGARTFITLMLILGVINVLLYNTGWVDWKEDGWDVAWAMVNTLGPLFAIYLMHIFDME